MKTLTIPAKCKNKKIIPLEPIPDNSTYDAVIILLKEDDKISQKDLLKIKPLSMGKIKSNLSREKIYSED